MDFYLFFSENDDFSMREIHYLSNVFEAEKLSKANFYVKNGYKYKCANNLAELMFFMIPTDNFYSCSTESFFEYCRSLYDKLIRKYGLEIFCNTFPKDNFEKNVLNELEIKLDQINESISKDWEKQDNEINIIENDKNFDKFLDEINDQMDNDDDGFWRISNDIN